jgi:hypothetical protein
MGPLLNSGDSWDFNSRGTNDENSITYVFQLSSVFCFPLLRWLLMTRVASSNVYNIKYQHLKFKETIVTLSYI